MAVITITAARIVVVNRAPIPIFIIPKNLGQKSNKKRSRVMNTRLLLHQVITIGYE